MGRSTTVLEAAYSLEISVEEAAIRPAPPERPADYQSNVAMPLAKRLSLPRPPRRIECFDIAHIQGTETVAAMVTFIDGVPARNLYRKFKVRSVDNNDFAAMYEVLTRRFRRRSRLTHGPRVQPGRQVPGYARNSTRKRRLVAEKPGQIMASPLRFSIP